MPASTSLRICDERLLAACRSRPAPRARRARAAATCPRRSSWTSCRVATVSSCALTLLEARRRGRRRRWAPAPRCRVTMRPLRAQLGGHDLLVLGVDLARRWRRPARSSALKANVATAAMRRPGTVPMRRRSSSGRRRAGLGQLRVILPRRDEVDQRGVHRLHPVGAAGLQRRVDLVGLALADQVADRRGRHEHLAAHHAPRPSAVGRSCWVTMPWRATESCTRT